MSIPPDVTTAALRCAAAGCFLLTVWCAVPHKTRARPLRRLRAVLGASWRYLVTSQKTTSCPDCARADRSQRTEISDEEVFRRSCAIAAAERRREQHPDVPGPRDGSSR